MITDVQSMLERDEGREYNAYPDPLTHADPWTIGVGHTGPEVHEGLVWTDDQIDAALQQDIITATQGCEAHMPWFVNLDDVRQAVLIGMSFQMGIRRLLGFVRMLGSVQSGNYANAAEEMRQSNWARQTPVRANRMASQMETGAWQ